MNKKEDLDEYYFENNRNLFAIGVTFVATFLLGFFFFEKKNRDRNEEKINVSYSSNELKNIPSKSQNDKIKYVIVNRSNIKSIELIEKEEKNCDEKMYFMTIQYNGGILTADISDEEFKKYITPFYLSQDAFLMVERTGENKFVFNFNNINHSSEKYIESK
jgi:hypothetical protein